MFVTGTLVADAMHVGSALSTGGGVDLTRVGGGAEAAIVLLGSTGRLLTAVVVACAGRALRRASLAPGRVAAAAYAVALGHLALVPTAWSGTDPAHLHSINGWGVAVAGGLLVLWVASAGLALLRFPDATDLQVFGDAGARGDGAPARA